MAFQFTQDELGVLGSQTPFVSGEPANDPTVQRKIQENRAWREAGRIGPAPHPDLRIASDTEEGNRRSEFFSTVQKIRNESRKGVNSFIRGQQAAPGAGGAPKATGGAFNNSILLSKNRTKTNILG
jgi:hypothetical protein